jgi:hypothetical protein
VLCERLNALPESSWASWNDDKGIRPLDVARRLKGFGVRSKDVRVSEDVRKGYDSADLRDLIARYVSPSRDTGNKGNAPARDVAPVAAVAASGGAGALLQHHLGARVLDVDDIAEYAAREYIAEWNGARP